MFGWLRKSFTRPASTTAAHGAGPDAATQAQAKALSQSAQHKSLGDQCLNAGAEEQAANHYRAAIAIEPGFAEAHCRLGDALRSQGEHVQAAACYRKALTFAPDLVDAHYGLGVTLLERSDSRNATVYFQLFDGFANHFDATLQQLHYDTPKKLSALIAQCRPDAAGDWAVLDLGCGTGLVGQELAPFSGQLVGVDLSGKMLEKARARNVYQRLLHGDLIGIMQEEEAARYDLIVAADTLIYLGKLDDVAREAQRLLVDGGLFAFSVEALEALPGAPPGASPPADYQLQPAPSCRYAHASDYIHRLATENHLGVRHRALAHLRNSVGTSVRGYLVVMEKRSADQAA